MKPIAYFYPFAIVCISILGLTFMHSETPNQGTILPPPTPLFDGKSFGGWAGDTEKTFHIEDGSIVGGNLSNRIPRNEFLCTTRPYTNFVLRLKFRLKGTDPNAGVQFRSERIPNHHEMIGYQADMGQQYWGCLYDESRRNKVLTGPNLEELMKVMDPKEWNEYVIRAEGPRIQQWINGFPTVDYTEKEASIPGYGLIGLQIHGGPPSEAWYKDIVIQELP